jgi:hypothetical protein
VKRGRKRKVRNESENQGGVKIALMEECSKIKNEVDFIKSMVESTTTSYPNPFHITGTTLHIHQPDIHLIENCVFCELIRHKHKKLYEVSCIMP